MRLGIPIDIGRDAAQELAKRELLNPVYAEAKPPWWQRATSWIWEQLGDLFLAAWGGFNALVIVIVIGAVIALLALAIISRTGGLQRRHSVSGQMFDDHSTPAADHRLRAESAARSGDWGEAVREGFRALVRQLEERGAIDPLPGRTATEAARDAGAVFSAHRSELRVAAQLFDEVAYGDRPGTSETYAHITNLDRTLSRSSLMDA